MDEEAIENVALNEDFKNDKTPDTSIDSSYESDSSDDEDDEDDEEDGGGKEESDNIAKGKKRSMKERAKRWKAERKRRKMSMETIETASKALHAREIAPLRSVLALDSAFPDVELVAECGATLFMHTFVIAKFYPRLLEMYPEIKRGMHACYKQYTLFIYTESNQLVTVRVDGDESGWRLLREYIYNSCLTLPETYVYHAPPYDDLIPQ